MISPFLVLCVAGLATGNVFNFHQDFVARFGRTESMRELLGVPTCAKYQCGTAGQFQPGQCIAWTAATNTYNLQTCPTGTFCPVALDTNSTSYCIEVMPPLGPNGVLPGDACGVNAVCTGAGDNCTSGICVGQAAGAPCGDQPDCGVGLVCANEPSGTGNDTCIPQIAIGKTCGTPLTNDNCVNGAVCINNKCAKMFSLGVGAIVSDDYAALACSTGFYKSFPPTGQAVCLPAPTSPNVPQPQACTPGSQCISADGEWSVPCECGLNSQGLAFCPPFPGDDIYQTYFRYLVQYSQSSTLGSCHYLNMGQELCGVSPSLWANLNNAKVNLDFYVRSLYNDQCVAAIFNADKPTN
jgi:hypothetical protein